MLNAIPIVGWFLSLVFSISLAIPFWIVWTACGIGETYAYWLPPIYQHPGFWDCVGIFIAMSVIKLVFVPKLASFNSSSESGKK